MRLGATGVSSAFMYAAHLLCGSFLLFRRIKYDIYDILLQETACNQRKLFRIRRTQHKNIQPVKPYTVQSVHILANCIQFQQSCVLICRILFPAGGKSRISLFVRSAVVSNNRLSNSAVFSVYRKVFDFYALSFYPFNRRLSVTMIFLVVRSPDIVQKRKINQNVFIPLRQVISAVVKVNQGKCQYPKNV